MEARARRIFFSNSDETPIDNGRPEVGDSVLLKKDRWHHLVRLIKADSLLVGEIMGFEPSNVTEPEGLNVGDLIEFREINIFTCRKGFYATLDS